MLYLGSQELTLLLLSININHFKYLNMLRKAIAQMSGNYVPTFNLKCQHHEGKTHFFLDTFLFTTQGFITVPLHYFLGTPTKT